MNSLKLFARFTADSVRIVVPAVTAAAIGIQLAFGGFALAVLEFGRELRLKRAAG